MIYLAAFVLALAFLIGGAPAVLTALWWLLLAFVVVCGAIGLVLLVCVLSFGVLVVSTIICAELEHRRAHR